MSSIKIICNIDNDVRTGVLGNVKTSKDLIPLVFYFMGIGMEHRRLVYFDSDFSDWIDFDSTCKVTDLPNPLRLKVVDVSDGSFYEGKDYETLRREAEEDEIMKDNSDGKADQVESTDNEQKNQDGIEVLSPSEIEDIPFSPEASIDDDTFEGIEFLDGNELQFDELGGGLGLD